ncbi:MULTISPECIES: hypothetical protein [unclassified Microbacterium]|uniref:hypothetical protein n=1 Tax=unclassified Microbacterium TaxID=2609290 RepID=UPI000EA94EB2|nr:MULTISPECIES: hypothetical protein [unclassified Microbacterium]MBT2484601.1 hypothetical protein [Microbacterium sp. ISL-108]RKN67493.1 hypothetical protein D7252_07815 [Microbacterium sp. CGR2]
MDTRTRIAAALAALVASVLIAGCTSMPGSDAPTDGPVPDVDSGDTDDIEGTLLDGGRMFAVVTWGSSTCVPQIDAISAEGQTVTLTLVDPQGDGDTAPVCTKDRAPRASVGALPEGVDPASEVTLNVSYGDVSDDVDLDVHSASADAPGMETGHPSAGWYDDGGLVLLTWGSSSCPPIVEALEGAGNEGTATFVTDDEKICTMDFAPRATVIDFGDDAVDDDGTFTLTLVGGGLDGTVEVR